MNNILSKEDITRYSLRKKCLRQRSNANKFAYNKQITIMCLCFVKNRRAVSARSTKQVF